MYAYNICLVPLPGPPNLIFAQRQTRPSQVYDSPRKKGTAISFVLFRSCRLIKHLIVGRRRCHCQEDPSDAARSGPRRHSDGFFELKLDFTTRLRWKCADLFFSGVLTIGRISMGWFGRVRSNRADRKWDFVGCRAHDDDDDDDRSDLSPKTMTTPDPYRYGYKYFYARSGNLHAEWALFDRLFA